LALVPPALAYAATVFEIAPLASYRFTIASSTLLIVLAGTLCGLVDNRRLRMAVAAITLCLAIITNPLFEPWLRTGSLPAQRIENWREAAAAIRDDVLPVVLCPNLVEDKRFADTGDPGMVEYYRFPLTGLYRVTELVSDDNMIHGRAIAEGQILPDVDLESISQAGGCWLLVRAYADDAEQLTDYLHRQLGEKHVTVRRVFDAPLNLFHFSIEP
ncbi:MAG: hypothetical protein ACR2NP_02765, partial [Pirellulaceae bacterium]